MGPSWVDPRSGEIINASVYVYHDIVKLISRWMFVQTAQADPAVRSVELPKEVRRPAYGYGENGYGDDDPEAYGNSAYGAARFSGNSIATSAINEYLRRVVAVDATSAKAVSEGFFYQGWTAKQ